MVSAKCLILQGRKLRERKGQVQGHVGLVGELGSEPRASCLSFCLFQFLPMCAQVLVSCLPQLCLHMYLFKDFIL